MSVQQSVWGGNASMVVQRYWLGRRKPEEVQEEWVIDWWANYHGERPHKQGNRWVTLLRERSSGQWVLVVADLYCESWTTYDVEVEQKRRMQEVYGLREASYRRGMAGRKPQ